MSAVSFTRRVWASRKTELEFLRPIVEIPQQEVSRHKNIGGKSVRAALDRRRDPLPADVRDSSGASTVVQDVAEFVRDGEPLTVLVEIVRRSKG